MTPQEFLEKLRPGGPWILTAITPDGPTKTITATNADEVAAFVRANNGKRNIYYSVNPTRTADDQEGGEDRHRRDRVLACATSIRTRAKPPKPPRRATSRRSRTTSRRQLRSSTAATAFRFSGGWLSRSSCEPVAEPITVKRQEGLSTETAALIADVEARVKAH